MKYASIKGKGNHKDYLVVCDEFARDPEFVGIGTPGAMNYYRIQHNPAWAIKLNKRSISGTAESVFEIVTEFYTDAWNVCQKVEERVAPMSRNPFTQAYLAEHPELKSA